MHEKANILAQACAAIDNGSLENAATLLTNEYPFSQPSKVGRKYSENEYMRIFVRDGFIDRYSGNRLVFPGTLRLLSQLLPSSFPFDPHWKTDACHFAYYELSPTIDHKIPISRGGEDRAENWMSTSMLRNNAKANYTVEELGWSIYPCGDMDDWDGLTGWFLRQAQFHPEIQGDARLSPWLKAARKTLEEKKFKTEQLPLL